MKKIIVQLATAVAILGVSCSAYGQNLFVNPGFEATDTAGPINVSTDVDTELDGWTQLGPANSGSSTDPFGDNWAGGLVLGPGFDTNSGNNTRHLGGGSGAGGIYQDVATVIGQFYTISLFSSGFPADPDFQNGFVSAGPAVAGTLPNTDLDIVYGTRRGTDTATDMGYFQRAVGFTASSTNTRVTFRSAGGSGPVGSITLDDVSMTATAPIIAGDVDGLNGADGADYTTILNNLFQFETFGDPPATRAEGDLDLDTRVTLDDFRIWKNAFVGAGGSLADLGIVPEPTSMGLAICAAGALLCRRVSHA